MHEAGHPKLVLCDNLEGLVGREVGGEFRMEGTHVYLWPIQIDVWQKPSQYCNYPSIRINQSLKKSKKIKKNAKEAFVWWSLTFISLKSYDH